MRCRIDDQNVSVLIAQYVIQLYNASMQNLLNQETENLVHQRLSVARTQDRPNANSAKLRFRIYNRKHNTCHCLRLCLHLQPARYGPITNVCLGHVALM